MSAHLPFPEEEEYLDADEPLPLMAKTSRQAQIDLLAARAAVAECEAARDLARARDRAIMRSEARRVGFRHEVSGTISSDEFLLVTPTGVRLRAYGALRDPLDTSALAPAWYLHDDLLHFAGTRRELEQLVPAVDRAEELGLSEEQVYFLRWSAPWHHLIMGMWRGDTDGVYAGLLTMSDFIVFLKRRIEHVAIKSATKI